jgi:hypothetical protein
MDFVGSLSETHSGHNMVLVLVDRLIKHVHFAPTMYNKSGGAGI